jgi:hypothetical protein
MRQEAIVAEAESSNSHNLHGGARAFFFKGSNGHWQEVLTEVELVMYEQPKAKILTPDCAHWLELGRAAIL